MNTYWKLTCVAVAFGLAVMAPPVTASVIQEASDPLGTGCLKYSPYERDAPFTGGKGIRMQPLCLPDPCAGQVSRVFLSREVLGKPATQRQWDTYVARYAEYCRAEAINHEQTRPRARTWSNMTVPSVGTVTSTFRPPSGYQGTAIPPASGGSWSFVQDGKVWSSDYTGFVSENPPYVVIEPVIAPVPLPAGVVFSLTALCALGGMGRVRR